MYRILVWGCGLYYDKYINSIRYQEIKGNIKIVGLTGKDKLYSRLDGYPFIDINDIECSNVDYVVVTSEEHYAEINMEARALGFREEEIISAKVFCLPSFRFEDYIRLLKSKVSIIANNCWGGTAYHTLGMRFYSPFINMFENDQDYLRMLGNLRYYLGLKLRYVRSDYNGLLKREYPVCRLDDVELHFNYYVDMEEVEKKWYERIERLNWNNIFVMMFTEDRDILEIFDKLDYPKKVCFVPFESPLHSAVFMRILRCEEMKKVPFWKVVNQSASGHFHDYDLIKLLLEGKINHDRLF